MTATIRRATAADAPALEAVIRAAYAPYADIEDLPDVAAGVAEDIAAHHVWVAEAEGEIAGGLVMGLAAEAHLMNVAVHPDFGGRGIGRRLLQYGLDLIAGRPERVVTLAVDEMNDPALALYNRAGFRRVARRCALIRQIGTPTD